jgi:uncharacterized protein (DUF488 family)
MLKNRKRDMTKLYTIGFTGKSAEKFFDLLKKSGVKKLVDTRVNNVSQLSGFAKGADLKFFTKEIVGIPYEHQLDFAPTKELLAKYREKLISWEQYEIEYLNLLDSRNVKAGLNIETLHENCFLCSEHVPHKCHRRLLAEYLQKAGTNVEIVHLIK